MIHFQIIEIYKIVPIFQYQIRRRSDIIQMKKLDLSSFQYSHKHILPLYADKHM